VNGTTTFDWQQIVDWIKRNWWILLIALIVILLLMRLGRRKLVIHI
jgi:type II secretory pathway component PulF